MATRLFVAGIPYATRDEDLSAHFASAGKVVSAKVIMDRQTGRSKGFGFVEMETEEEAQNAVSQLNGSNIGDRQIIVKEAYPMKDRNDDGGNFRGGNDSQ